MSTARRVSVLLLALLSLACRRGTAASTAPEAPGPVAAPPAAVAAEGVEGEEIAAATGHQPVAQTITFSADPESATQIQGAPKRPPLPRFRLFGTRDGDGPN